MLKLSPGGRRYGLIPQKRSHLDFGVARLNLVKATLPAMDNSRFMGPVLDQGQQGSCTAHASAADREFLHWKQIAALGQPVNPGVAGLFSPSFIYYKERELDGTLAQGDCGSSGRSSCQVLRKFGCATRVEMPYSDAECSIAPTADQLKQASQFPTGQYHFLQNVQDMKDCIASGFNFRIGFAVYSSFEDIKSDGVWTADTSEQLLGYHETLGYGYDDIVNGGSFLVRNSWAKAWGRKGDFYMRYEDAADKNVLQDAAIQHLGKW